MASSIDGGKQLEARIKRCGVTEDAIKACMEEKRQTMMGLTDDQWRNTAASYLCDKIEEFLRYGGTVTWNQK